MTFLAAWLRLELPRRWRQLAVLALLIAVASGTVLAAVAGARRGATVVQRLHEHTLPATSAIYPNSRNFDWDKIRALPEVETLSTFVIDYAYSYEGYSPDVAGDSVPADANWMRTIEKPVVFAGRVFDPNRADEVVVTPVFAAQHHKHVGDTVVLDLASPKELADQAAHGRGGAFTGPHLRMHIVGVVSSPWLSDEPGSSGIIQMSPGVVAHYPDNTIGPSGTKNLWNYVSAIVRLRGGEATLPQFRRDAARVTGRTDLEIQNLPEQWRPAQRAGVFEARWLLAFGIAAFAAALLLIGQAVSRYVAANTTELQTMRALGVTTGQGVGAAAAAASLAGIVGASLGVVGAYVASQYFPLGLADLIEPAPGWSADWVVFGPGFAIIALLVGGGAAGAAWVGLTAARRNVPTRRSTIAGAVARWGLAVPVVVGTRFALEQGRGRTAVPVRPALIGAVLGVAGVVAAFTFSHGVSDATSHPERFGQTFHLVGYLAANGEDSAPAKKIVSIAAANPDVTGIDDARQAIALGPRDNASIPLYTYSAGVKAVPVVLTSGRMPATSGEVLLAPRTLAAQRAHVGSRVRLTGDKGVATYTVTGSGFVPNGPRNGYAEGGWITPAGYDTIFTGFKFRLILVTLRPGADIDASLATLAGAVNASIPDAQEFAFRIPDPLIEVAEIRQIRVLPIVLGAFLALLAAGAVGHVLVMAVRRRSYEVAVLRALGMTPRQARRVVVTQASVLALIGILLGVPLGLAAGRVVWRVLADYTPLHYEAPMAVGTMLIVGPAALLLANILAAIPGRRAARLEISRILRTE